jgi:hypothetical protein
MTELSYAYGSLTGPSDFESQLQKPSLYEDEPAPPPKSQKAQVQAQAQAPVQVYATPAYQAPISSSYENQDQKLIDLLKQIKQTPPAQQKTENQSYFDKLFSKRKELWKALQITFIILLAISIHFVIDHYLKVYINNTDLSFERELFIRLLYPIAIIFILWNLKTFVK